MGSEWPALFNPEVVWKFSDASPDVAVILYPVAGCEPPMPSIDLEHGGIDYPCSGLILRDRVFGEHAESSVPGREYPSLPVRWQALKDFLLGDPDVLVLSWL